MSGAWHQAWPESTPTFAPVGAFRSPGNRRRARRATSRRLAPDVLDLATGLKQFDLVADGYFAALDDLREHPAPTLELGAQPLT